MGEDAILITLAQFPLTMKHLNEDGYRIMFTPSPRNCHPIHFSRLANAEGNVRLGLSQLQSTASFCTTKFNTQLNSVFSICIDNPALTMAAVAAHF